MKVKQGKKREEAKSSVTDEEKVLPTTPTEVQTEVVSQLNLLTKTSPGPEVNKVGNTVTTKWAKVPVAMDSGSMANVTPPTMFSCTINETAASKAKESFHVADNSPIPNPGSQSVVGKSDSENPVTISVDFDVANITRPLGSVSKLVNKQNRVVFDEHDSYIENKKTGEKVPMREENGLFYLDIWTEIPSDMVLNPVFARQVVAQ